MSHYACSLCRFWPVNCMFWPVNCIFWPIETLHWLFRHYSVNCIKIGGYVALLSGPTVYSLYCAYTIEGVDIVNTPVSHHVLGSFAHLLLCRKVRLDKMWTYSIMQCVYLCCDLWPLLCKLFLSLFVRCGGPNKKKIGIPKNGLRQEQLLLFPV